MGNLSISLRDFEGINPALSGAEISFGMTRSGDLEAREILLNGREISEPSEISSLLEDIPLAYQNSALDNSVPRVFWLVHPSLYAPPDFVLGHEYTLDNMRSSKDERLLQLYEASVNSINKLHALLSQVKSHKNYFVIMLDSGQTEIDRMFGNESMVPEITELISGLEREGKLYIGRGFPSKEEIAAGRQMTSKSGIHLIESYHVLCGISAPGCVSYAATILRNGRDIEMEQQEPYAEKIFFAPQFTTKAPFTPIYFSPVVDPSQSSKHDWPHMDSGKISGFVPRLMF